MTRDETEQTANTVNASMVDCSKVVVRQSTYRDAGLGAFAKENIGEGELVEQGVARVIRCDGNKDPYLFTWSENRTKWAFCSGCAPFYNTSLTPNTRMERDFENNTFSIYAYRDIMEGEELTHTYRSLGWRDCFSELNKSLAKMITE
jgi:hypothetical protein